MALVAWTWPSCGGADSAAEAPKACTLTWDGWADGFFATWCRACHSANTTERYGAPEGVNFDTEADIQTHADAIWRVVFETGTMPVGGGLPENARTALEAYFECAYP